MGNMKKPRSLTAKTVDTPRRFIVKCAMTSCGIEFPLREGINMDGDLYCCKGHAEIERTIRGSK